MKIFLSHQKSDSMVAIEVKNYLKSKHNVDCYLDLIDPKIKDGEDIAIHVKEELAQCTQLLAIVSEATKLSWWVPWEIGIATEKDYPLATFGRNVTLPEYLMKWPYLKNLTDLDAYAEVSKEAARRVTTAAMDSISSESFTYRRAATKHFYKVLRSRLGQ
ncbi:toll/interleukin-1 receptor domain-containing protein [Burkholderia stagnalis]|uniref:toll/interleukin-1 receptor domain-containing protein n=1 Tax=Burkholderia stagnalis TaxID=1503054 RepID=UPI002AB40800|nr:toll/interleukin-1 receptor domain-containing protein [Burkholderia stagnalis]MDY7807121.1 toll/interleukin-1 receptor domain-containing protein [Burkholderia stagnalis]